MKVGLPLSCLVLLVSACVDAERRPSSVGDGDTAEVDDGAEDTAGPDTGAPPDVADGGDGEVDPGECTVDGDCDGVAGMCQAWRCEARRCVLGVEEVGAACDDGNPCTGDGRCASDQKCEVGLALEDGTSCDDGLVCNGVRTCAAGICQVVLAMECEPSTNPCVLRTECSEGAGGVCVEVPKPDGEGCNGPEGGLKPENWQCSRGVCVPPDMVVVAAGSFTMGCPQGQCGLDNAPAHEVTLSAFAVDRDEVSEGMFQRCLGDADGRGVKCAARTNEGQRPLADTPATWPARYLDWVNAATVCRYQGKRLCTEAEWERAARGAAELRYYPWGAGSPTCARANYWDPFSGKGCGTNGPGHIGSRPDGASADGARDLAGNVAEWVADFYRLDLYGSRAGGVVTNPVVDTAYEGNDAHVVRGGAFNSNGSDIRTFVRSAEGSAEADEDLGARCCLSLEAP